MKLTYHEKIIQRSPEWSSLRLGRIGGSTCAPLLINGGKKLGSGALSLAYKGAAELINGYAHSDFVGDAMQEGIDMEPLALETYKETNFVSVREVGYISLGKYFGVSPDGLVGRQGAVEVKVPQTHTFLLFALTGKCDKKYVAQCQWLMWITSKGNDPVNWVDLYFFNYTLGVGKSKRLTPDPDYFEAFDRATKLYEKQMDDILFASNQLKLDTF